MIGPSTTVYAWICNPPNSGERVWLAAHETVRNQLGELVIKPEFDDDPREAKPMAYSTALILKRRLESEGVIGKGLYDVHFSLHPTGDEVGAGHTTAAPTDDNRVVMQYRGLLVRPGIDVKHGRVWYVKFPGTAIESIRGATIEEAVDKCYERNLQDKAEQAPAPPPAPPEQPAKKTFEGRIRPGYFTDKGDKS
jgi:hypothetical protein